MSSSPPRKKKTALLSGLGIIGATLFKFKVAILTALKAGSLLKFGWIIKSFFTMFLSLGLYAAMFGWRFALILILCLLIHEGGHWIWMKALGLNPKAPVFVPFVGAYVAMTNLPADEATHAWVAFAGPLVGGIGAAAFYWLGLQTDNTWLMAGGSFGFMLNLWQLIPAKPFDGGFIISAVSKWLLVPGTILLVILAFVCKSILLGIISFFTVVSVFRQFSQHKQQAQSAIIYPGTTNAVYKFEQASKSNNTNQALSEPQAKLASPVQLPAETWQRWVIGTAYVSLAAILGSLYSISNSQIAERAPAHSGSGSSAVRELLRQQ